MSRHHTGGGTAAVARLIAAWEKEASSASEDRKTDWGEKLSQERAKRVELRTALEKKLRAWPCEEVDMEHRAAADVLAACATMLRLKCTCCGRPKLVENACTKRWCPVCSAKIAALKVRRYSIAVERLQWPLFVTLTLPGMSDVVAMMQRLRTCWKKFRRTTWWQKCEVKGGLYAFEIAKKNATWHVHLHSIIDCRWLAVHVRAPQRGDSKDEVKRRCTAAKHELNAAWSAMMGAECKASYVSRTDKGTVREALKYSVTPDTLLSMSCDPLEVIKAMRCARLTQPFGSLYGLRSEFAALEKSEAVGPSCAECGGSQWSVEFEREKKVPVHVVLQGPPKLSSSQKKRALQWRKVQRRYEAAMAK